MDKLEELALQVSTEAATKVVLSQKEFLESSQNSQENTCARASFLNNVTGLRPATVLKKTLAQVFSCEFCEISKNIFFTEHLLGTASLCHLIPLVRFFQGLKYAYVVHISVFLDLIWFACFYDLMNRGLFRTLSNIQVGAFWENS